MTTLPPHFQPYPQDPARPAPRPRVATYDQRERNMSLAVSNAVAIEGWRVESQSADQVILAKQNKTKHWLHALGLVVALVLTLSTGLPVALLSIIIWIVAAVRSKRSVLILRADGFGNILRSAS